MDGPCRNREDLSNNHPDHFAMNSPCRIVLADNHPTSAAEFRAALEAQADFMLAAAVTCASCTFAAVSEQRSDLLILNLNMPDHRILELVKDLAVLYADLKILIVTRPNQHLEAGQILRAGAHGCVSVSSSTATKLSAVRQVLAGKHCYIAQPVTSSLQGVALPLHWLNAAPAL
jgi:DNA-binding NarL/FixJ family response regulator